jgi:hypothetical protein
MMGTGFAAMAVFGRRAKMMRETWRPVPFRNGIMFHRFLLGFRIKPRGEIMARKYSKGASEKVEKAMHERKRGTLKSGSGRKVKSRKQAIAIGLSEARKEGKMVPKRAQGKK